MNIEICPHNGKMEYLGQIITFHEPGQTELQHRINWARATFTPHREELTQKLPAGTWAMTEAMNKQLRKKNDQDDHKLPK